MEKEVKVKKPQPDWEGEFLRQLSLWSMPLPVRQYQGIPDRKFKFDFTWVSERVVVEIEGGTWGSSSRHTSRAGFKKDCEKYNLATFYNWRVFRFTSDLVKDGTALTFMRLIFEPVKEVL